MISGPNQMIPGLNAGMDENNKFSPFWNYWNSQQNNLNLQNQLQGAGFDPLHFFIDLRVSGHIYDKKLVAEGVNANEPLNLQKQNNENETLVERSGSNEESHIELEDKFLQGTDDEKRIIKIENEQINTTEVQRNENKMSNVNSEDNMKVNSAFEFPMNGNSETENRTSNNNNKRLIKAGIKNKTKTNYGINYILNNLPKIYKNFNENVEMGQENSANNEIDIEESDSKDLKYLKSYHNNLRSDKNVYTFQNNYEHFTKIIGHRNTDERDGSIDDKTVEETKDEELDKTDRACHVDLDVTKDSSDDEDNYRDVRNDFVDVENSESELEDCNGSENEFQTRQGTVDEKSD